MGMRFTFPPGRDDEERKNWPNGKKKKEKETNIARRCVSRRRNKRPFGKQKRSGGEPLIDLTRLTRQSDEWEIVCFGNNIKRSVGLCPPALTRG